jgi:hypothetical protein
MSFLYVQIVSRPLGSNPTSQIDEFLGSWNVAVLVLFCETQSKPAQMLLPLGVVWVP